MAIVDEGTVFSWHEFREITEITENLIGAITKIDSFVYDKPILFLSKNSSGLVLMGAAFATMNIPFQGVDYNLGLECLRSLIQELEVKYIFVAEELESRFLALADFCRVIQIENFIKKANLEREYFPGILDLLPPRSFCSYSFTSGTTDVPKIAYRTTSFDKRRFEYLQKRYEFNIDDTHLVCLPMYHVSSTGWLRLFLSLGCTVVVHNFKNGYDLCETLHGNHVSTTIMSPYMLKQAVEVLEEIDSRSYFPYLRFVITGGKNCPIGVKKDAIGKLGKIIFEYYGTTETGINTLIDSQEALEYPGSVGRVFEGNKIVILDEKNQPVFSGEKGKIAVHSYMNIDCYFNGKTNFVDLFGEKYFITSDYGYLNGKGYLFIIQRANAANKKIFDLYGIENEILNLGFISDVSARDAAEDGLKVEIVPKKYFPYAKLKNDIGNISAKYGIESPVSVNVVTKLDYTLTGKIRLSSNIIN